MEWKNEEILSSGLQYLKPVKKEKRKAVITQRSNREHRASANTHSPTPITGDPGPINNESGVIIKDLND